MLHDELAQLAWYLAVGRLMSDHMERAPPFSHFEVMSDLGGFFFLRLIQPENCIVDRVQVIVDTARKNRLHGYACRLQGCLWTHVVMHSSA